jgi:hypothetical protein
MQRQSRASAFPTLSPIVLPVVLSFALLPVAFSLYLTHSNMPTASTTNRIPRHDEYYIHGGDVVFHVRISAIGHYSDTMFFTQTRE